MTTEGLIKEKRMSITSLIPVLCVFLLPLMLYFGGALKQGAAVGIRLSFTNIIPTLFPFFILSDIWTCCIEIKGESIVGKIYERIFRINKATLPSYILGSICGFPLGVKGGARLYENNAISKDELERLSGFANNPSAAFVISGIGAGLYGDIRVGIMLYFAVLISSILVGCLFRSNKQISLNTNDISRQSFNFVNSVRSAGVSSLTVSCYIIFFSAIIGMLREIIKEPLALALAASLLEITNASSLAAELSQNFNILKYTITAFALGFSGFSVHMQTFALLPREASRRKYLCIKLAQGLLCSAVTFVISFII